MTVFPADLKLWLRANGVAQDSPRQSVSGGCISEALCIESPQGALFVKFGQEVPTRFYEAEAEGLDYLHQASNLRVPDVLAYGEHFIVMNYIRSAPHRGDFWEQLARQLAGLHDCQRQQFGFINDNFCGETPQINTLDEDGHRFFAERRLLYQARLAADAGLLGSKEQADIHRLCRRLPELVPEQPASLLHGDLWSGNIHASETGEPVFIDPAVYFGWAETDLAMTRLFGGFPESFYDAYTEVRALESGWRERLEIYQLYPLLNHLNLFGGSYLASVQTILKRFA